MSTSMSQHPITQLTIMVPSLRKSSPWRRLSRWTVLIAICAVGMIIYMSTSCWSGNPHSLFDRRRLIMQQTIDSGQATPTCFFGRHHQVKSLLVRPMKHVAESNTIRTLTVPLIESLFNNSFISKDDSSKCSLKPFWRAHHDESAENRRSRLERICANYQFDGRIFTYRHKASNRAPAPDAHVEENIKYCSARNCPLLVDERHNIVTCFVQKVASTTIKKLYVHLSESTNQTTQNTSTDFEGDTTFDDNSKFHINANNQILRISPASLRNSKESSFFKTIFVRHPFVRLISAFKDKAEKSPEQQPYFYARYWNPLLKHVHGEDHVTNETRVQFKDFIEELLLPNDPYQYNEHWAPIWTRCEPCFIHYDLIGKLETSETDLRTLTSRINQTMIKLSLWHNVNPEFATSLSQEDQNEEARCNQQRYKYTETVKYLSQLRPQTIIELYKRYYLDFELFGYTLEELFQT